MIEKPSILPADEVGFAFDEMTLVVTHSEETLLPGMVLVATGIVPLLLASGLHGPLVYDERDDYVLCKRACNVVDLDEDAQFCVCLDTEVGPRLNGYRFVRVAPLKPAETIQVRTDAPVREGTLLARAIHSGSVTYRALARDSLFSSNEVIYVAAGDGVQLAPGTVQVRAHRVSRQLGEHVVQVVTEGAEAPAPTSPKPEAGARSPMSIDASQPVVKVLMLDAEAERTRPGMTLVSRGDVRFYDGHMWHVYERENSYNEDCEHKLVATGDPPAPAPEDYLRIVTAVGTLPPERMDSLPEGEDEDEDEEDDTETQAHVDNVKLLEHVATPGAPPILVQTEAADALVSAMRVGSPRRTGAMESARRMLAGDLGVRVLARLAAGLAEQGDKPSVAYELARSEAPWRRVAAAFLLPKDHLPFLCADPDEDVRSAARLASDPDKFRARQCGGRTGVITAIKSRIIQAANIDDRSAIDTLSSLWSEHPEPPAKIDEALQALAIAEQDGEPSGLGMEAETEAIEALARLWETDSESTGSFDGVRVEKRGCSHVETDPDRLAALVEGMRAEEVILTEDPMTDDQPTELDPLAKLRKADRDGQDPEAVGEFVRRRGRPVKPSKPVGSFDQVLNRAHARAIQQQRCPMCGGALRRQIDPRQSGVGCGPDQQWVNYRCSKNAKHFVVDRPEPIPRPAVKEASDGLPPQGIFQQLGWPSGETVVVEKTDPSGLHNTLLLRYDWRQEGGAVLPVCRVANGEELPPRNLGDLWVAHGMYAKGVDGRHYVRAVNIAARPDGGPSVLDAIDRASIRDDLGWAEQLITLGVRVQVDFRLLQDELRWPTEDVEQRKRIMRKVSQVTRSVVIGEPVETALGYLADLHASWAGMTGDLVVVPGDLRVDPGLLLRRVGWRGVRGFQGAPECVVALAGDFFEEGPETVEDRDLLVATGETVTAVMAGVPLRLAQVHHEGDHGPDRVQAALRGTVYPLERVTKLEDMGVVVRFSADPSPPTPVVTVQEERAMDAVFGDGAPDPEAAMRADLAAARRAERVRHVGFGPDTMVGWSACEDQGMTPPNPEVRTIQPTRQIGGHGDVIAPLTVLSPDDIPDGNDGPLGADSNDPEVKKIEQSLWGDETKIVTDVSTREAERARQLADLIDREGPEAVVGMIDPHDHVHHATVRDDSEGSKADDLLEVREAAEDAPTFALIDEALEGARPGIEAIQHQVLTEEVEAREREVIAGLKDVSPSQEEVDAALTEEKP